MREHKTNQDDPRRKIRSLSTRFLISILRMIATLFASKHQWIKAELLYFFSEMLNSNSMHCLLSQVIFSFTQLCANYVASIIIL